MIKTTISSLQFITNDFSALNEAEQIEKVCEAGVKWVQLRLKNCTEKEILTLGKEASRICKKYGATLILNDYPHLVKKIGAQGVHLGKQDMPPSVARDLLGDDFIIGGTANSLEDIYNLAQQGVNYIGLGPFRFTQTKKNLAPVLGFEGYREIIQKCNAQKIHLPIVGIGGITESDVLELLRCGLHGIALSSALTSAKDMVKTSQNYLKLLNDSKQCKN